MKSIIRAAFFILTITTGFAFNFTSEDFDTATQAPQFENIEQTVVNEPDIRSELNQNEKQASTHDVTPPPPAPSSAETNRFYTDFAEMMQESGAKSNLSYSNQVNVEALAKKIYWVHSFKVMELDNKKWSFEHKANTYPQSVASVIKLPLVNIALKEMAAGRLDSSKQLAVVKENIKSYDGEPVGQKYSVTNAIYATLYRSSNTCPNLLAKEFGGLKATKAKLNEIGYNQTGFNYLSAVHRTESPNFKVGSTATDLANSVHDFYHKYRKVQDMSRKDSAWYAFTHTKYKINVPGAVNTGGKIGTNSISSTYAGIYRIDNKDYIIVTLIDKQSFNKKYKGSINATNGDKALEDANTIIVSTIKSSRTMALGY